MTDEARDDEATLVGRVVLDDDALRPMGATLRAGGKQFKRQRATRFVLELDDAARVNVDVASDALVDVERAPLRHDGRWGELAARPIAVLFDDVAPGDHVDVELEGWVLEPGARIAIRGRVVDVALSGGGPRDAAAARPHVIEAQRIAFADVSDGDGDARAVAELERLVAREAAKHTPKSTPKSAPPKRAKPEPPPAPRPWRIGAPVMLAFAAGWVVTGLATWPLPIAYLFGAEAALFVILALAMWLSRPPFEAVATSAGDRAFRPTWQIGARCAWAIVGGVVVPWPALVLGERGAIGVTFLYAAAIGIAFVIGGIRRHRTALRLARLVLGAKPLPRECEGGAWGRFSGSVESSSTVVSRDVAYTLQVRWTRPSGHTEQPSAYYELEGIPESTRPCAFAVRSETERVEVEGDLLWGAPIEYQPVDRSDPHKPAYWIVMATRAAIKPADDVVVLSRVRNVNGAPAVRGSGPESLILFGAREDALGTLRRLVSRWFANAIALVVVIGGCAALGIWHLL